MAQMGIVVEKPKKRVPKKIVVLIAGLVVLIAALAAGAWYFLRPVTPDRTLVERAITAIDKNDQASLTAASDSIRSKFRYDTLPEYLTILTISSIRNDQASEASKYLQKLKALGEYTYVDYVPWKDRASVLSSLEHDVAFLQKTQNFQGATPHTQDGDK